MEPIPNHDVTYNNNKHHNHNPHHIHTHTHNISKLSFIVIGAGLIGPRHASHIISRSDCQLFAIIDHSAKGPIVAQQLNTLLFKNLDELFHYCQSQRISYPDAAIIATPNHTHVQLGLKLASKGIHLLVEKPLAPTASDCKTLIDYCRSHKIHLLIGHHRRFNPYIITTKKNLNKLGKLVAIQGSWTLCKPPSYFLEKHWRSSVELGGGTLLINLIHDLDLLQYLLGPIDKVYAELLSKQRVDRFDDNSAIDSLVDEGAALTLRFRNGCCGTFICSDNVTSPFSFEVGTGENPTVPFNDSISGFYRIFGSHGTISVPDLKLYHQQDDEDVVQDNSEPIDNSMRNNYNDSRSWLRPIVTEQLKMDHETDELDDEYIDVDMEMNSLLPTPSPSPNYKEFTPIHKLKTSSTTSTTTTSSTKKSSSKPKPFDLQLDHFINILNGKESVVKCTGEDALQALLCIEAVIKSIKSGLPQYVEDIDTITPNNELLKEYM
ncbi:putative oxidoreductase [Scheffersomyces coipomensis]|uniref:putative oxidoreductase n=1 Tax=Scheffersomyces coipomensis TaxID=1788519 RepID=UPI00315D54BA